MSARKILSNKSIQLRVTAIMFSGVWGLYRKSMWKYASSRWFIFTQMTLSAIHNELYASSISLLAKTCLLRDDSIWNCMSGNTCELSPVYATIKFSLRILISTRYFVLAASYKELHWRQEIRIFSMANMSALFPSKRPKELTVINGSGRGTAAPTWGLAPSSVFI